MKNNNWIRCPVCGNKTRDKIREDTILKNYPLYCPKCKQETLIEVTNLKMTVIAELVHRIINNCHFHLSILPIAQDKKPQRSPLRLRFLSCTLESISCVNIAVI